MWATWGLLVLAAGLGLRHAMAPDHLAAVGTFVRATRAKTRQSIHHALRIGGGHALGMLVMGIVILGVAHSVPKTLVGTLSCISGLWLMLLSTWILLDLLWPGWRFGMSQLTRWREQRAPKMNSRSVTAGAWGVGLLFGIAVSPGDLAIFTLALAKVAQPMLALSLFFTFLAALLAGLSVLGLILAWRSQGLGVRVSQGLSGLSGFFGLGIGFMLVAGFLH
ncbi:hypothetical protein [Sulfobacillus harzensis]|uniref:Nickel/cobalt efflux system n=1 Tax=Sulfobacillus harzensis TaxID=2729629 RepID=A0A7Y0Q4N0_9FIRM|nr:hypothetical protein [Sulfobacillus harzensis]NMP23404.1 hypothetical protein [Sulfobacillus harzensis]